MAIKSYDVPLVPIKDMQGNTHPWYMAGSASIDDAGRIRTTTRLESHVQFSGFTGGMAVAFLDGGDKVIHMAPILQYGVDGSSSPAWLGATPSPRTVEAEFYAPPAVYEQTSKITIALFHFGKNRLTQDIPKIISVVKDVIGVIQLIVAACGVVQAEAKKAQESIVVRTSAPLKASGLYGGISEGPVKAYVDANYGGRSANFWPGRFDMQQLAGYGIPNDSISSIKVPNGWRVTMYQHAGFQGATRVLLSDTPVLPNFNDTCSSMVVDGPVCVFEHDNFSGRSQVFGEGRYDLPSLAAVPNDAISSVKVPVGWQVTLYEHAGFGGASRVLLGDTPSLPGFNDKVSSLVVKRVF